jgi:hypothetical protein
MCYRLLGPLLPLISSLCRSRGIEHGRIRSAKTVLAVPVSFPFDPMTEDWQEGSRLFSSRRRNMFQECVLGDSLRREKEMKDLSLTILSPGDC